MTVVTNIQNTQRIIKDKYMYILYQLYLQTDLVERFLQFLYQQMNQNPIWQGNNTE